MSRLAAHGVAIAVPHGWEGRIIRRAAINTSFPMPEARGDFGVGVTDLMRSGDVFVTLFEYGPESLGQPLFAKHGVPRLTRDLFTSRRLQRTLPGQVGCQLFFTAQRRPFCLYVVVAGRAHLNKLIPQVNKMLDGLEL